MNIIRNTLFVSALWGAGLHVALCGCDVTYGPAGGTECVQLEGYWYPQWATCLTNTYIQLTSGGEHICRLTYANYCYYQCMIEVHDEESGYVSSDCRCGGSETTLAPPPTIPEWCNSPDGTDCTFYRECLEARYPCSDTGNSYALSFGERFCGLYEEHISEFTQIGQEWINAARKCLQIALVPLLRPFERPTCAEIEKKAFASHTGCYLNPYEGAPSICDIGFANWMKVFATVRHALDWKIWQNGVLRQNVEILNEGLQVGFTCAWQIPLNSIRLGFKKVTGSLDDMLHDVYNVVDQIRDQIGNRYEKDDLLIYPFINNSQRRKRAADPTDTKSPNVAPDVFVDVILAEKSEYDLNYQPSANSPALNIEQVTDYFLDAVESDEFKPDVSSRTQLLQYDKCNDVDCDTPTRVIEKEYVEPNTGSRSITSLWSVLLLISVVKLFV